MRILFAGTPEFAAAHLRALLEQGDHTIVAVYTQPDRKAGRGKKLQASPVKQLALDAGLPVQQPQTLKDESEQQLLASYNADIMVVVAYGMLLPDTVLDIPANGCINVHASLLPRWRGAAPVERAIMAGDQHTGITIMQMDAGLDTGDELLSASCTIADNETGDSLRNKLIALGQPLLLEALELIAGRQTAPKPQDDSRANYASKLLKTDAQLDWQQPAIALERQIRALTSALNCFTTLDGKRVGIGRGRAITNEDIAGSISQPPGTITLRQSCAAANLTEPCLQVRCTDGALVIDRVQMPGGKAMSLAALLNGKPDAFQSGQCFDLPASTSSRSA